MHSSRHTLILVLTLSLLTGSLPAIAQVVTATIPVGEQPVSAANEMIETIAAAMKRIANLRYRQGARIASGQRSTITRAWLL